MSNPYAAFLQAELTDALKEGHEMPFDEDLVERFSARASVVQVLRLAENQHRPVMAWMLRRWLAYLRAH